MKSFIRDDVSKHTNVFDVLKERGFIEQCTHEEEIRELLGNEKIKFYIEVHDTLASAADYDATNERADKKIEQVAKDLGI